MPERLGLLRPLSETSDDKAVVDGRLLSIPLDLPGTEVPPFGSPVDGEPADKNDARELRMGAGTSAGVEAGPAGGRPSARVP